MSLQSLLNTTVHVYTRDEEADTWTRGPETLRCRITALSASGARRESPLPEPNVTHICRMVRTDLITGGQHLKRLSDGQEFEVRSVRHQDAPVPGQTIIGLAQVANAID